jgi:hypothetical protein
VVEIKIHARRASDAGSPWQHQEDKLMASSSEKLLAIQLLAEAATAAEEAMGRLSMCGCVQGGVKLPSKMEKGKPELCFHEEGEDWWVLQKGNRDVQSLTSQLTGYSSSLN